MSTTSLTAIAKKAEVRAFNKYEGQADPFGVVRLKVEEEKSVEGRAFIFEYGLEVDKETHRTSVVVSKKIDLDKLVQSYKEQCGLQYVLRMVQQGRFSIEDICDDGKHGFDITGVPTFAGDALRELKPKLAEADKLKEALGLPKDLKLNEANLEKAIGPYVESYFNKLMAAKEAAAKKDEGGKE